MIYGKGTVKKMFKDTNVMVHIQRLHENAVLPEYKTENAAGFDLASVTHVDVKPGETLLVATGWAFEVPEGYELQLRPRSGVSLKTNLRVILGTIDSDYRGEVRVIVQNVGNTVESVSYGERIAQGVLNRVPKARFMLVNELSTTQRGSGGYGSTGK